MYRYSIALAGGLFAALLFGTQFVAGRHGILVGLQPGDLVTLRFAVTGMIFLPVLWRRGIVSLAGIGWHRGLLLTVLAGAPYALLVMTGLSLSSAVHGSVLNPGATPLAGFALTYFLLGQKPSEAAWVGVLAILFGLGLVAGPGLWLADTQTLWGDLILVASAFSYALFTVLVGRWQKDALSVTAAISVLSALLWLPSYSIVVGTGQLLNVPPSELITQIVFQGLLGGGLAVFLFVRASTIAGPARAVLFPAVVPVFGVVIASVFLAEPVSTTQMLGVAVVCGGMAFSMRSRISATDSRR